MNRSTTKRIPPLAAAWLVSGGLSVAALALITGTAHADTPTVIPEAAAQTVVDVVSEATGFVPNDVTCPSGVDAVVGQQFECAFTGPEGPYTAFMEINKVDGSYVEFGVTTLRD
jgi:hypothetical protein